MGTPEIEDSGYTYSQRSVASGNVTHYSFGTIDFRAVGRGGGSLGCRGSSDDPPFLGVNFIRFL